LSLSGKKILVTRAAHQAVELVRAIEQCGGEAIVFPTIEIVPPPSWETCDRASDNMYMYDGLIFTSTNGVEFFFRRLNERNASTNDLTTKMIFVVGDKTKDAIERHGLKVTLVPERFTAFDLSKQLGQEDLHGKAFLFPRGNLSKDTLPAALKFLGASVDSIVVYHTTKPKQENVDEVKSMLLNGDINILTFTSPSTFNNFAALFSTSELADTVRRTKIAVIGPVTAKTVEDAGLEADIVSKESTIEAMVGAIEDYYGSLRQ
jgi:uroporphyrinogen-III synthase